MHHKNTVSQLEGQDLDSQKLLTDLLKKLQKLHFCRLQVWISQVLAIGSVEISSWFSQKVDDCLLINVSKIFERTGKVMLDLTSPFYFYSLSWK